MPTDLKHIILANINMKLSYFSEGRVEGDLIGGHNSGFCIYF